MCKMIRVGFAGRESIASQGPERDMVALAKDLTDTCRMAKVGTYYYVVNHASSVVWSPE